MMAEPITAALSIIALINAGAAAVASLAKLLGKVQRGEELIEADRALLKQEQAAAEARFDAAIVARMGGQEVANQHTADLQAGNVPGDGDEPGPPEPGMDPDPSGTIHP